MHIIYMVYTIYNSYLTLVGIPAKGWNQAFQLNWPMMSHMGSHMELEADLRVTWTPRIPIFETPVALSQNYALLNNHHHAIFGVFFRKLEETQGTSGCRGCLSKLPAFLTNHFGLHPLWNRKAMGMNKACKEFWMGGNMNTLQEINISHQTGFGKSSSKCPFLGDMLVPWRVSIHLWGFCWRVLYPGWMDRLAKWFPTYNRSETIWIEFRDFTFAQKM